VQPYASGFEFLREFSREWEAEREAKSRDFAAFDATTKLRSFRQ
jgi:hypothetical protein